MNSFFFPLTLWFRAVLNTSGINPFWTTINKGYLEMEYGKTFTENLYSSTFLHSTLS